MAAVGMEWQQSLVEIGGYKSPSSSPMISVSFYSIASAHVIETYSLNLHHHVFSCIMATSQVQGYSVSHDRQLQSLQNSEESQWHAQEIPIRPQATPRSDSCAKKSGMFEMFTAAYQGQLPAWLS